MITKEKRAFVRKRHTQAISHMVHASGFKKNKWKTYVTINGKRKEVLKNSEEEVLLWLFDYYAELEKRPKTLRDVFEKFMDYKEECLGRSRHTIYENRRMFDRLSRQLQDSPIEEITDEDIQIWVTKCFLADKPREEALRKQFQLLNQIFAYGIRKKICAENPMIYLTARDYMKNCSHARKRAEEKAFSEAELEQIRQDAWKEYTNPRALMALMAMETGLRAGELSALHKSDIKADYIHVHRQQCKKSADGKLEFFEVAYTKDERMHPHDGRYVPITDACRKVIFAALNLPGESEYLFHEDGQIIAKDSYARNLLRRCRRLGIMTTNNHAFRMAFNSRMIGLGLNSADRAMVLGHAVQTNETVYSLTDKRRLAAIKGCFQGT